MYHHAIPGQTSFVFNFPRKSLIKRKNKDIFGLPERPSAGSENVDTPELNSLIKMHINCGAQQQWVYFIFCFARTGSQTWNMGRFFAIPSHLSGQLFGVYCRSVDDATLCIAGHKFHGPVRENRLFALFAN